MRLFRIITLVLFSIALNSSLAYSEDLEVIVDLKGSWKFSIGDNPEWSKPEYNDKEWDNVVVPMSWEANGFEGYNGFAWYRKEFTLSEKINEEYVYLYLGYIDDADEVYLNGKLVGSKGKFPPIAETAFRTLRKYSIPAYLINANSNNTIAIRVFDYYEQGGIISGPVGLYIDKEEQLLDINLSGYWNFETEAEIKKRIANKGVKSSNKIFVPSYWENSGYDDYDGKARYLTQFKIPHELFDKQLYLVLGYIDDVETVYVNNEKIGSVFNLKEQEYAKLPYVEIFRGYKIPREVLNKNGINILSVMVYDKGGLGGIYAGPVGIATEENFELLKKLKTRKKNTFEIFLDSFNF